MLPERGGGEGGPCPRPSGVIRPRDQPGGRRSWAPSHRWGCHPCPHQALPLYRNLPLQPVPSGTCLGGRETKMRLLGRWDLQPLNEVRFDRHPARTPPVSDLLDRDLPGGGPLLPDLPVTCQVTWHGPEGARLTRCPRPTLWTEQEGTERRGERGGGRRAISGRESTAERGTEAPGPGSLASQETQVAACHPQGSCIRWFWRGPAPLPRRGQCPTLGGTKSVTEQGSWPP